ncbi:GGDEF domain-containing protein [Endothiovibrio diazotrophicus]
MKELFTLSLLVEPDRQRFARFVIDATRALDGDLFSVTARLYSLLQRLREEEARLGGSIEVGLRLEGDRLVVHWDGGGIDEFPRLPVTPEPMRVEELAEQLRMASETADPELLKRRNRKISEDLERFTKVAAQQMAEMETMLERKKEELEASIRQAETDALTGLLNRGAYDDRLRKALARAQRQGEEMVLLLLDLDHFKQINDTHGHQYGDDYLRRMAEVMERAVRENVDLPCRIGGDEFAIIAFTGMEAAERIAQRVLEEMNRKVSIGIARALRHDSVDTLVARTDEALYAAKAQGRGRFVSARAPLREVANG